MAALIFLLFLFACVDAVLDMVFALLVVCAKFALFLSVVARIHGPTLKDMANPTAIAVRVHPQETRTFVGNWYVNANSRS